MGLYKNTLYSRIADAATNTVTDTWVGEHYSSGTIAANFGVGTLYRGPIVANGALQDMARIGARWTDVSAGSEDSGFFVQLRRAGVALATNLVLTPEQFAVTVGGGAVLASAGVAEFSTAAVDGRVFARSSNASGYGGFVGQADSGYQIAAQIFGSGHGGTRFGINLANSVQIYAIDPGASAVNLALGSFAGGSVTFGTNNTGRWQVDSSGHFVAFLDNTYDIGQTGATRPRHGYFSGRIYSEYAVNGPNEGITSINTSNGTGAIAMVGARNGGSDLTDAASLLCMGTAYTTAGGLVQDGAMLLAGANLSGGLSISAAHATTGDVRMYAGGTTVLQQTWKVEGRSIMARSLQHAKGADVVSAGNLPILLDGDLFYVTGTTTINGLPGATHATTPRQEGSRVTLIFEDALTVKHNTAAGATFASIMLAGSVDFLTAANSRIVLELYGTLWYETARTVA